MLLLVWCTRPWPSYVLEALRKPPTTQHNTRMLRFGMFALDQFKSRLPRWPQYCQHILNIPHLREHYPGVVAEITLCLQQGFVDGGSEGTQGDGVFDRPEEEVAVNGQPPTPPTLGAGTTSQPPSPKTLARGVAGKSPPLLATPGPAGVPGHGLHAGVASAGPATAALPYVPTLQEQLHFASGDMARALATLVDGQTLSAAAGAGGAGAGSGASGTGGGGSSYTIVAGAPVPPPRDILRPAEHIVDLCTFVVNNITEANSDDMTSKLRMRLAPEYLPWFANFLVTTRVASQANFQMGAWP